MFFLKDKFQLREKINSVSLLLDYALHHISDWLSFLQRASTWRNGCLAKVHGSWVKAQFLGLPATRASLSLWPQLEWRVHEELAGIGWKSKVTLTICPEVASPLLLSHGVSKNTPWLCITVLWTSVQGLPSSCVAHVSQGVTAWGSSWLSGTQLECLGLHVSELWDLSHQTPLYNSMAKLLRAWPIDSGSDSIGCEGNRQRIGDSEELKRNRSYSYPKVWEHKKEIQCSQ